MKTELKPCPFCGGEAEVIQTKCISNGYVGYRVWHFGMKCPISEFETEIKHTQEEAIRAWNTRTPQKDVEEVKHGRWMVDNKEREWRDENTYRLFIECSECGKTYFLGTTKYQNEYNEEKLKALGTLVDYSFCSKCGAKMDGNLHKKEVE